MTVVFIIFTVFCVAICVAILGAAIAELRRPFPAAGHDDDAEIL